jgi:hypothetical protein
MAKDVATQTGGIQLPARFKGRADNASALGEGISSGFPIIRLRGKQWSLSTGKDEEHDIDLQAIDVVILRAPPFNSRSYYESYKGAGSKGQRPICWSMDGKRPDTDVPEPESTLCDTCERNRTYTNDKGMKVRDCSNGKRLAVLPWVTWTTELLGKPLLRPCLLRVPGSSLQALKAFGEDAGRLGFPYYGFVTTISFDRKAEFPKLIFNVNNEIQLDDESAEIIDAMREQSDAYFITGERTSGARTVGGDHEEAVQEEAPKPKPKAVSLAQAVAASKVEDGETKEVEAEIIPPEKPKKAGPKTKVTHNGKEPAETKAPEAEADAGDEAGDDLKNEVLGILGKL